MREPLTTTRLMTRPETFQQGVLGLVEHKSDTIYVDPATHRYRGQLYCHLFSNDIEALHAFAARLGLKHEWFQKPPKASWMHYDTNFRNRINAIQLGAVAVDKFEIILVAHRQRGTLTQEIIEKVAYSRSLRRKS